VVWQSRLFLLLGVAALLAAAAASCRDIDEPPPVLPDGGLEDAGVDGAIS